MEKPKKKKKKTLLSTLEIMHFPKVQSVIGKPLFV